MSRPTRMGVAVVVAGLLAVLLSACGQGGASSAGPPPDTALPQPSGGSSDTGPANSDSSDGAPTIHIENLYYLGDGPAGPLLHSVQIIRAPGSNVGEGAMYSLEAPPDDARWHTVWNPGWISSVKRGAATIDVELATAPAQRPRVIDEPTARISVQQLVYSLQSALGTHDPVRFLRGGRPATAVLGEPASRPVQAAPFTEVMALVSVLEPELDESVVGRHPFTASGVALTADHRVTVRLEQGGKVLQTRAVRLGAKAVDHEFPWQATFTIKGLKAGSYQVVASGADPRVPSRTQSDQGILTLD